MRKFWEDINLLVENFENILEIFLENLELIRENCGKNLRKFWVTLLKFCEKFDKIVETFDKLKNSFEMCVVLFGMILFVKFWRKMVYTFRDWNLKKILFKDNFLDILRSYWGKF